ncbi:sulfite exporter TauE/SafE family protein [Spirulina sp. CS-785/01]|uniref:sulfite exporter TauE/SafE family protein n=1 Tax=Spirulina sp. CS-785/01 TaxID=3021716 RepID=UPI00232CD440|nr:sulfite exporter TauE/SafE family protein [Spirulina sp. CS-785/01]MDB9311701.1 sulfite exporter TauE/SafE family protein [Spirulina sp. CS-785/01]
MTILCFILASSVAWFISSLAGGGSPLILIPVVSLLVGTASIPPIITTGMLFGNAQRVGIYWKNIDWYVTSWNLPGAIAGGVLGAFVLSRTRIEWLSVLLAFFLIASVISFLFRKETGGFSVKAWYFLPIGFLYAFFSGLIGSTGPVLNPFYLNYGLVKEEMIGTKSLNVLVVHIAKMIAYGLFGVLNMTDLGYGLVIGLAALPGNWLGQIVLQHMSDQQFRQVVMTFVAFSGAFMLWQQRQFLVFW